MEQHVMFSCPSLGLDIGKYDTIKTGIRELLYSQLGEDKGVAACLIIHTCNKGIEKVSVCVDTLCKYVENIVRNAEEEKYRKIRQSNKAYQERVCCVEGALLFLEAAGFVEQELPFNDGTDKFWVFPTDGDVERLEGLSASLRCAEPLRPTLERSAVVLLPRQAAKVPQLPPEFYNISKEEMQREKQLRSEVVEQSIVLRTKAMRERQSQKDLRKYRFTLLRIRFPDGLTLQGTFRVAEKLSAVMQFVREYLVNDWRPFFLCPSAGKRFTSEDEDQGLSEHLLVPSAMLNFAWDLDVTDPGLDDSVMLAPHAYELISQDQLQDH
uniref:UBX domain-containing protein 6-like n=2 Tax=Hirondellea gigas TaxID=1518452 RepID=A0A6A7FXP5_9CRUS